MTNPLTMKLQRGALLTEEDRLDLDRLVGRSTHISGRQVVLYEGDPCSVVHVVLRGWACRFKIISGGSRQIIALMLPGDHSPVHSGSTHAVGYGLCALTSCELAEIDGCELNALLLSRPSLAHALRGPEITDESVLMEWLTNVGGRPAERRMAHLLCELLVRLQIVGLATADTFVLPLTQSTLGDALGLSSAHVNRTIQSLRSRGLVFFEESRVVITNVGQLQQFGAFNARYLQNNALVL